VSVVECECGGLTPEGPDCAAAERPGREQQPHGCQPHVRLTGSQRPSGTGMYVHVFVCSGNQMGHRGAAMLAKALLCNCRLSKLEWDHNDTPLRGFQEVTAAMKQ